MFVGDGKGKTVISGAKSVFDNVTTFHTASFGNNSISSSCFQFLKKLFFFFF